MTDIRGLRFVSKIGDGKETACLMSARALLDGRAFDDDHPSQVLRALGIQINDGNWWDNDAERTTVLMPLALDERLCASRCDASPAAEIERARLCAHHALSWAVPFALDHAALAMESAQLPEQTARLQTHAARLRSEPTAANSNAANAAAYAAAYAAANAAAYAAAYPNSERRKHVRDSLIALFQRLLDVRAEVLP
jgi:hypothetical protein